MFDKKVGMLSFFSKSIWLLKHLMPLIVYFKFKLTEQIKKCPVIQYWQVIQTRNLSWNLYRLLLIICGLSVK